MSLPDLLQMALERRKPLLSQPQTNACRLVNAAGDGLPSLTLDRFADALVLSLYETIAPDEEARLLQTIAAVCSTHFLIKSIYLKRRPREARHLANTERAWLSPPEPVWGEPTPELEVLENNVRYLIRPGADLSVGLFLDMRETRAWLRAHARGLRVLNTFAYTCAFGVCASLGQAGRVVNLDLSRRVLDWGEDHYRLNRLGAERQDFIAGDVFDWLKRMGRWPERFDLLVLDPPSYAKSRLKRFSAAVHYDELIELAVPLLAPGGLILACCNHAGLTRQGFVGLLRQGLQRAGRVPLDFSPLPVSGEDFPGEAALKVFAVRLR